MIRFILPLILVAGLCSVVLSVEPPATEAPKYVKPAPGVTLLETTQAELAAAKAENVALRRRVLAQDGERVEAQGKIVLMRDEILRLTDALSAERKGT